MVDKQVFAFYTKNINRTIVRNKYSNTNGGILWIDKKSDIEKSKEE